MKTKRWSLFAAMAMAAGLGVSMSMQPAEAGQNACLRMCSSDYTWCWYSCTPGDGGCYTTCQQNYYACAADCQ
jgi:hypothetical protein